MPNAEGPWGWWRLDCHTGVEGLEEETATAAEDTHPLLSAGWQGEQDIGMGGMVGWGNGGNGGG